MDFIFTGNPICFLQPVKNYERKFCHPYWQECHILLFCTGNKFVIGLFPGSPIKRQYALVDLNDLNIYHQYHFSLRNFGRTEKGRRMGMESTAVPENKNGC